MPNLIDTHSHLHFPPFDDDRQGVLARMKEEGVWTVTVGTTIGTSEFAIRLAESAEEVWATVGYHPEHFTSSFHDEAEPDSDVYSIEKLKTLAQSSKKVVAVGETGLDFFRIDAERDAEQERVAQEMGFRDHLALAHDINLPLVIHCREAFGRLAQVIQDEKDGGKNVRGVVHCFTGSWEEAKPLLDLGLHLSFTGIITFPPRKKDDPEKSFLRVIERMPLNKLMVETDAPWLAPVPHRGERNDPTLVKFVAEKVATLRGISYEEAAKATTKTAGEFFHLH